MSEENTSLLHRESQPYDSIDRATPERNRSRSVTSANVFVGTDPAFSPSILSTSTDLSTTDQMVSTLPLWTRIGFGLGHIYNDLCAGVWFSYTLLFMQGALLMPGTVAGALMMLGQVGDALFTPIVGYLIDRFGTKQKWHIIGTILVFITFPMIFSICPMCSEWPAWWHIFYFTVVIILFQLGWPIVQVSHLAIIPEMARTQKDRSQLTSLRYSASVISNIIVFVVTLFILRSNRAQNASKIGPKDAYRFRDISLILTLIGLCMTAFFQFSLTFGGYGQRRLQALEQRRRRSSLDARTSYQRLSESHDISNAPPMQRPRKNFFKSPAIYQNAFLYVFSRLFTTTALVYVPLWLDERLLQVSKSGAANNTSVEHIATVPMVTFLSSFFSSLLLERSNNRLGHRLAYLIASLICIGGCVLVEISDSANIPNWKLFTIAILFGAGSSGTMISSLCLIANMIGKHADQSGFVYSAVTFADKFITGVAILIIESLKCMDPKICPNYYKNVLSRACGGAAILGVLILSTLNFNRRQRRLTRVV